MKTFAVRLVEGDDLLLEINKLAQKHEIEAGVVLSAVGSLGKSKIRLPVLNGKEQYITPENLEIDSLQGTISKNGCHLHITVSDSEGKAFGGHLKEGCIVRTTCEMVIGTLENTKFSRESDKTTGFDELKVE